MNLKADEQKAVDQLSILVDKTDGKENKTYLDYVPFARHVVHFPNHLNTY